MAEYHRLPDPVVEKAKKIRDERDMSGIGEAIRLTMREAGYDV